MQKCNKLTDPDFLKICQVSCWNDKAVATGDGSLCEKNIELINSTEGKLVCLEEVAMANLDPTQCTKLNAGLYRDMCYVDVASALNDSSICDNVGENDTILTKDECVGKVNSG